MIRTAEQDRRVRSASRERKSDYNKNMMIRVSLPDHATNEQDGKELRVETRGFPRQEYWSGCHFLLQGIFPTQGSNPGLPHCRHHYREPPAKPPILGPVRLPFLFNIEMSSSRRHEGPQDFNPGVRIGLNLFIRQIEGGVCFFFSDGRWLELLLKRTHCKHLLLLFMLLKC